MLKVAGLTMNPDFQASSQHGQLLTLSRQTERDRRGPLLDKVSDEGSQKVGLRVSRCRSRRAI